MTYRMAARLSLLCAAIALACALTLSLREATLLAVVAWGAFASSLAISLTYLKKARRVS